MRRARLRDRLLTLVALAVLPAFALIIYTALEQRRTALADAERAALHLANHVGEQQQEAIEAARHLLLALSRLPVVRTHDGAACSRVFADIVKEFPRYSGIVATTPQGDVVCSGTPLSGPVSLGQRPLYERARTTQQFAAETALRGGITGKSAIVLVQPVIDDGGAFMGVVATALDRRWLTDRAREAGLPPGAELLVVDQRGAIVVRQPEGLGAPGEDVSARPHVKNALARAEGVTQSIGRDGGAQVVAFTRLADAGYQLTVIVGTPEAHALAPATFALWRNVAVLGVVALCVFAIAWFGAEPLILRPIRELAGATRRFAGGDLMARAAPSRVEEIGALAGAFNDMSATIAATQTALSARLRDSAALLAVARVVGGTSDLGQALRLISRELSRLTGADTVAAFLVAHDRSVLQPVAGYHLPKDALDEIGDAPLSLEELRVPAGLFDGRRVVWSADVTADPQFANTIFRKFTHQSAAMVPLQLDGETWGGFYLIWWTQERRLADDELALLQGIGEEVGVLIRTVRLYQEAEARRRIAEAAKERYRELFERNLAGVFRSTRDGRMIECNEAFARMNGFGSREEALERLAPDYYADPADRVAMLARLDEDRRVQNFEFRARRANGDVYWGLLNISRGNDGSGEYLEGIVLDVSDRKHAAAAELEVQTLRSVAALANAAAHEINNPLAVVVGHIDLEISRTEDPATRERLGKARGAAQRIREIVSRMHHITRLEIAPDPSGLPDRLDIERSGELI